MDVNVKQSLYVPYTDDWFKCNLEVVILKHCQPALTYVVSVSCPPDGVWPPGEALHPALQPRILALADQQPPRYLDKPEKLNKQTRRQIIFIP